MKNLKLYHIVNAPPDEVFVALTNPITIQLWSGQPAEMNTESGTEFSLFDESIVGINLNFETGKMIRQEWYFGEADEPSIVTIKLHQHVKGTSMEVSQTNIPDVDYENILEGWQEVYFAGLDDFYEEG
jgi:activator of HSP90 ATPase